MAYEQSPRSSKLEHCVGNIYFSNERADGAKLAYRAQIHSIQDDISRLQQQKQELLAKADHEAGIQRNFSREAAEELVQELQNPHCQEHPITRVSLLLPVMGQESLANTQNLAAAEKIGQQFFDLNEHLENSEEPLPFLVATYRPGRTPGWYGDLHISYGHTTPASGLVPLQGEKVPQKCPCGQEHYQPAPALELPVQDFAAVKPSVYNHEYFTSNDTLVSVNGYRSEKTLPKMGSFFKEPQNAILLPTGRIFTESAEPLVRYEVDGEVREIRAASHSASPYEQRAFCAIGLHPVKEALDGLLEGSVQQYQGNEHMIDMYSDVNKLVVNGLRLARH